MPPQKPAKAEKPPREKQAKRKANPKLIAAARELRDRWLEQVNDQPALMAPAGKYEVARSLAIEPPPLASHAVAGEGVGRMLPAA